MAQKNLRIVYANRATAVSGDTNGLSLNDYKSSTYTTSTATVTITTSGIVAGNVAVMVMLAERVNSITASITGNGGLVAASVTEDSASNINSSTGVIGYGGGKYVTVYTTCTGSVTSIVLTIPSGTKISRIIVGNYWTPTYNTQFGVSVNYVDNSSAERLQSGDLFTQNAPRHKTLSFDLQYLNEADKFILFDIMKSLGKITPIFVSVFPDDDDKDKEQMYQIYGKFSDLGGISHTMFTMYASSIQLEEI